MRRILIQRMTWVSRRGCWDNGLLQEQKCSVYMLESENIVHVGSKAVTSPPVQLSRTKPKVDIQLSLADLFMYRQCLQMSIMWMIELSLSQINERVYYCISTSDSNLISICQKEDSSNFSIQNKATQHWSASTSANSALPKPYISWRRTHPMFTLPSWELRTTCAYTTPLLAARWSCSLNPFGAGNDYG